MEKYIKNMLCWFCGNKYQIELTYNRETTLDIGCERCLVPENAPTGTKVVYGAYDRASHQKSDKILERDKTYTIDQILHFHNWIDVELLETRGNVGRDGIFDYYLFTPADFDLTNRVCAIKEDEFKTIENEQGLKQWFGYVDISSEPNK